MIIINPDFGCKTFSLIFLCIDVILCAFCVEGNMNGFVWCILMLVFIHKNLSCGFITERFMKFCKSLLGLWRFSLPVYSASSWLGLLLVLCHFSPTQSRLWILASSSWNALWCSLVCTRNSWRVYRLRVTVISYNLGCLSSQSVLLQ